MVTLKGILTNKRITWHEHVLRMMRRIQKKALNMKVKGKCSKGRMRSRWEQQVRKDITQKEGRT
jgi:hypothetical protein